MASLENNLNKKRLSRGKIKNTLWFKTGSRDWRKAEARLRKTLRDIFRLTP
ncbi:hypothetical protein ENTCAN_07093 [Enterobacter cancerogenus ATCC 35316]|nr:hypothetical protein ENTCAN_07093 [Enterobacter cancerogenus ATCC 35316]